MVFPRWRVGTSAEFGAKCRLLFSRVASASWATRKTDLLATLKLFPF